MAFSSISLLLQNSPLCRSIAMWEEHSTFGIFSLNNLHLAFSYIRGVCSEIKPHKNNLLSFLENCSRGKLSGNRVENNKKKEYVQCEKTAMKKTKSDSLKMGANLLK